MYFLLSQETEGMSPTFLPADFGSGTLCAADATFFKYSEDVKRPGDKDKEEEGAFDAEREDDVRDRVPEPDERAVAFIAPVEETSFSRKNSARGEDSSCGCSEISGVGACPAFANVDR